MRRTKQRFEDFEKKTEKRALFFFAGFGDDMEAQSKRAVIDIPKMMKALVKEKEGKGFTLKEVPVPECGADQVLVRVEMMSLCGSDVLLYNWSPQHMAREIASIPFIPGHEGCGVVVQCGRNIPHDVVRVGQRVAPDTHIACEQCYQCRHDDGRQKHVCQHMQLFGHNYASGCGAEYCVIPVNALYVFKTSLPPRLACVMEPFGVSYRCVEECKCRQDTVLIIGVGPIGLACIPIAKHFGARKILCIDVSDARLATASTMGATSVINVTKITKNSDNNNNNNQQKEDLIWNWIDQMTDYEGGVGNIIEASGSVEMVCQMTKWLRKGGYIVQVGLPKGPIHIENPLKDWVFKEMTLKTLHGRRIWDTWNKLEPLLFSGQVDVEPILTHTVDMTEIDKAFQYIADGTACKVQVKISE